MPSPDYPSPIINVKTRNLLNKDLTPTQASGCSKTVLNTGVRVTSTIAGNNMYLGIELGKSELLGKTITLSSIITPNSNNNGLARIYYGSSNYITRSSANADLNKTGSVTVTLSSTFPENCDTVYLILYSNRNGTGVVGSYVDYTNLQVEEGSIATDYVPYNCIGIKKQNKNLLNIVDGTYKDTSNELTAVVENGEITVSGTTTNNRVVYIPFSFKFQAQAYTCSANNPVANSAVILRFDSNVMPYTMANINQTYTYTFNEIKYVTNLCIRVATGNTVTNFKIKPMLEQGSTATDYVEHQEENYYFPLTAGQKLMQGSTLEDSGNHNTRKQIVFDGSDDEIWMLATNPNFTNVERFEASLSFNIKNPSNSLCSHFKYSLLDNDVEHFKWEQTLGNYKKFRIYINKTRATTVAELRTWLQSNPITIEAELQTAEIIPYTTEQQTAWNNIKNMELYKGINNIYSDAYAHINYTSYDPTLIDEQYYTALSNSYELFNDSFKLGTTPSNIYKLNIAKEGVLIQPKEIILKDNTTTFADVEIDNIQEEDYTYNYSLTDKMVDLDFYYDASEIFEDDHTTLLAIAQDICEKAGLTLGTTNFRSYDKEISWYDNTRTARQYIGYIAELNGGFARIVNKTLYFVKQKTNSINTISFDECEDYKIGEYHKITRVVYELGALKYEFGDETGNTLYLNSENVYITEESEVQDIYNDIKDFEFYSLTTTNCPIDYTVKAGDVITFTDGTNNYPTIAQYDLDYFGNWIGGYNLDINTEKQEETQIIGNKEHIKNLQITVNRQENELESKVQKDEIISTINQSAEAITIDANKINLNGAVSANGNFEIDQYGNVEITDGSIQGASNITLVNPSSSASFYVLDNEIGLYTKSIGILANEIRMDDTLENLIYVLQFYDGELGTLGYIEENLSANNQFYRQSTIGNNICNTSWIDSIGQTRTTVSCDGIETPTLTQTSREEDKKNFEKLQNGLDIIKNTDIYKYNLKTQQDTDKKHIGFVIGKNFKYAKEITSANNNGVDPYSMISVAYKAIQEQQEQIEKLQTEIEELKNKIK